MVYFKDLRKQVWATIIVGGLGGLVHTFPKTFTSLASGMVPGLSNVYPITWQNLIGILTLIYGVGLWMKLLRR